MNKQLWVMMVAGLLSSAVQADVITFGNIDEAIPDNDSRGYVDVQTISGMSGLLTNISVNVVLSAIDGDWAYNGDYFMTLQHGSGYAVLLNRIGKTTAVPLGYDDDGLDVTFSLLGSDIHTSGGVTADGTLTGDWGVDGRETDPDLVLESDNRTAMLSNFLNSDPNGEWRLFVADLNGSSRGELNSWSINVETVPEPTVMALICLFGGGLIIIRRRFQQP